MLLAKDLVLSILQSAVDAVNALPDATPSTNPDVRIAELEAQVMGLQGKVDAAAASLAAEILKEADLQSQKDAADAKIAKALADLQGL